MLNVLSMLAPKPWYRPEMPCSLRILMSIALAETGAGRAAGVAEPSLVVGRLAEGTVV